MKNRRQIAFDKLFVLFIVIGVFFIMGALSLISEKEYAAFAIAVGAGIVFIAVPSVLMPFCYLFDSKGVTFCYILLPNERYLW